MDGWMDGWVGGQADDSMGRPRDDLHRIHPVDVCWRRPTVVAEVGQGAVTDLRNSLYRHVLDQSFTFLGRTSTGSLMSNITTDVERIQSAVSEIAGDLLKEGLTVVGLAVVPLQGAAWLVRGLVFEYVDLTALAAYTAQYRRFMEINE